MVVLTYTWLPQLYTIPRCILYLSILYPVAKNGPTRLLPMGYGLATESGARIQVLHIYYTQCYNYI